MEACGLQIRTLMSPRVSSSQVWNQASKLQIGRGDFLTFRVQDADAGSCSEVGWHYRISGRQHNECSQDLDDTASFFAKATLDFDRMVPSGSSNAEAAFRTPKRFSLKASKMRYRWKIAPATRRCVGFC